MSKLSLILHTFSVTGLVASLFLTLLSIPCKRRESKENLLYFGITLSKVLLNLQKPWR